MRGLNLNAFTQNFLGQAPDWYKSTIFAFLVINPILLLLTNPFFTGWVLVLESWYPGWRATVDGVPAAVHRANARFQAVPVPADAAELVLEFRSDSFRTGAGITLAALLASLAALIGIALRRRPRP